MKATVLIVLLSTTTVLAGPLQQRQNFGGEDAEVFVQDGALERGITEVPIGKVTDLNCVKASLPV